MTRKGNFPAFQVTASDWMYLKYLSNEGAEGQRDEMLTSPSPSGFLLPSAEKHHVAMVTKGGYCGCFRSQRGEVRKCVQNSWQTRWILLVGVGGEGDIFGARDSKALEELVTDYFIREFEIQAMKSSLAPMRTVKVRLKPLFLVSDRLRTAS